MFKLAGWVLLAAVAVGMGGVAFAAGQSPTEMREFIPLPGPDGQGQQPQQGECEPVILLYHEGQLYQLRPGPNDGQGRPGAPREFYQLNPYQGPPVPGLPAPPMPLPWQDRGPAPSSPNLRS